MWSGGDGKCSTNENCYMCGISNEQKLSFKTKYAIKSWIGMGQKPNPVNNLGDYKASVAFNL